MKLLRNGFFVSLRKIISLVISLAIIFANIPLHAVQQSLLASPGLQMLPTIESAANDQAAIEQELLGDPGVTQPEPFRIKVVEPIRMISRDERLKKIEEVGLNPFLLESDDIYIDLLTDSGTGAMSQEQMAALMVGDETYAGSRSFRHMKETIQELLGFPHVLPAHQGRGAEQVFDEIMIQEGQVVPGNRIFDTSMAHIELRKGVGVQLPIEKSMNTGQPYPFKGNVDLARLWNVLKTQGDNVAYVLITITDNTGGGQPVSMKNIKEARALAKEFNIPFIGDIARFAENAMFIKAREKGYNHRSIPDIVREMMDQFDAVLMSAKKDAMVPIGGFIAMRDKALYDKLVNIVIVREGFPTYGGMSGQIMEALAQGLREVVQEDYLKYRLGQARYLGQKLKEVGIPIVEPVGGHAVFVDAKRFLPHISPEQFPAQALAIMLYIEGGIRSGEIGTLLAGRDPHSGENKIADLELTRLTIPRRVYTTAHLDYIVKVFRRVWENRNGIRGLEMTFEPPVLRHFQGQFKWVEPAAVKSSELISLIPSSDGAGNKDLLKAM